MISYLAQILQELNTIGTAKLVPPDHKHNIGRLLGEAFLWDSVWTFAEAKSKQLWKGIEAEKIIDTSDLLPGAHTLTTSPSFAVTANISNPVKRFSPHELAKKLSNSKYKVPVHYTIGLCEQSKVPGNSNKTIKVVEK